MSQKYPGGRISSVPPTPSGPYQDSTASGVWTLEQQAYWEAQNLWPTAGAVNPDAFIENLFQTWLYTGNGSTQTINNGIDLSTKGGMVWIKDRSAANSNQLTDTVRGATKALSSNTTNAEITNATLYLTAFNNNGFTVGGGAGYNASPDNYASWTFRKQPKFFDVVTYTGNSSQPRAIAHNLGSTPGCVIVKNISADGGWFVYHRGANAPGYTAAESYLNLNNTNAVTDNAFIWGNTAPTSTQFTVSTQLNQSGNTYVAYLFAHNAGGFGLSGTDNVISCGSYTGNGSSTGPVVTLGYEPQWVLVKNASQGFNWKVVDVMRGMALTGSVDLEPNTSGSENAPGVTIFPNATGFTVGTSSGTWNANGNTFIYIAIRRGPMKVPTTGTSVFSPVARTGTGTTANITAGFTVDLEISKTRPIGNPPAWFDRLRGRYVWLRSNDITEQTTTTNSLTGFDNNTSVVVSSDADDGIINFGSRTYANWMFGRAPGFFDVVCFSGTGSATTQAHNLGVVPELMIVKRRTTSTGAWRVYDATNGATKFLTLNATDKSDPDGGIFWNSTAPTSSVFSLGTNAGVNASGSTYVAYLFASCPGVSKVGNYTGTGTTQVINCGFTAGSRFVLIKRTDSTGDWYVWDSARGIVAGNDPYLLLNSTAAEVTNTDFVDTAATGFEISSTAPAAINASGGTFIFLAIA